MHIQCHGLEYTRKAKHILLGELVLVATRARKNRVKYLFTVLKNALKPTGYKVRNLSLHSFFKQLLLSPLDLLFQRSCSVFAEPRHFGHVNGRILIHILAIGAAFGKRFGGHGEPHVAWAVDELEDGRGGLVRFSGLHAQHTSVATWAVEISFTEGAKELWEEGVGSLNWGCSQYNVEEGIALCREVTSNSKTC